MKRTNIMIYIMIAVLMFTFGCSMNAPDDYETTYPKSEDMTTDIEAQRVWPKEDIENTEGTTPEKINEQVRNEIKHKPHLHQ